MKYLILLILLASCGGTYDVEVDEVKGGTIHTFAPDFEAWYKYCEGKAQYQFEVGNITSNEIALEIKDCYYNLDLELPELPDNIGEQNVSK